VFSIIVCRDVKICVFASLWDDRVFTCTLSWNLETLSVCVCVCVYVCVGNAQNAARGQYVIVVTLSETNVIASYCLVHSQLHYLNSVLLFSTSRYSVRLHRNRVGFL